MLFTAAFVLATVPFFASAIPVAPKPQGISIPISKRSAINKGGVVDVAALRNHLANVQTKYDRTFAAYKANTGADHPLAAAQATKVSKRATGADALTDSSEELWYGSIKIGTPAVSFTVDFDTGSSDLFVPDASCSSCGSHTTYDASQSSTSSDAGQTFSLQYGDGSTTSGEQYTDVVTVAGLTAKTQTLGSATDYSSSFQSGPTDGLMGLAYPAISSYGASPFFNTLISQGTVSAGTFGFHLASSGSELFLGGSDTKKYSGSVNWNPVTQQGYWQIDMDSINVSDQPAVSDLSVIVDSGTTLIVGDDENVANFWNSVPGSADASDSVGQGFYTFPCSSSPSVSATFSGVSYTISAQNLNLGSVSDDSSDCVGAIVSGNEGFWIMGDTFMKNVYTIFDFDNNQVGFAESK